MIDANEIEARLRALGKKQKPERRWLSIKSLWLGAAVMALPLSYAVDEYAFPVVSRQAAIFSTPLVDGKTRVQFLYEKNRDCRIIHMQMILSGDTIELLSYETEGPLLARPVGRQLSRIFVIDVPQSTFIERGRVIVQHRCHWLWTHTGRLF